MTFPLGKLPYDFLAGLLARAPVSDPRVLVGPGTGLDCAILDLGERCLVFKSDPITFATEEIGWYAVQVNANDIATTGGDPRWMLATLLLPEGQATPGLVEAIFEQLSGACRSLGVSLVGGHTEVTYGLKRPIISAALVGEVARERLVMPGGARPGDALLLTKGVPVEAVSMIAREFPARLSDILSKQEQDEARDYLYTPGISVVRDARIATRAGQVTAMHDPTEGGLASALWELADASRARLEVDLTGVPVPALARKVCQRMGIDPLAAIASGALLIAAKAGDAPAIRRSLEAEGIRCAQIGQVQAGEPGVFTTAGLRLARPQRDEIARLFEGEQR